MNYTHPHVRPSCTRSRTRSFNMTSSHPGRRLGEANYDNTHTHSAHTQYTHTSKHTQTYTVYTHTYTHTHTHTIGRSVGRTRRSVRRRRRRIRARAIDDDDDMLLLFETPAGFSLFKVKDEKKLSDVEVRATTTRRRATTTTTTRDDDDDDARRRRLRRMGRLGCVITVIGRRVGGVRARAGEDGRAHA